MRKKIIKALCISVVVAFACVGVIAQKAVAEQQNIADNVLRFHVLANSDSQDDQDLKLQVRDSVIEYVQSLEGQNLKDTKEKILANLANIEEVAKSVINENGYNYTVLAKLEECEFPTKDYGDISLPAGIYEALRVEIGASEGHNWWCVIYPNICFVDAGAILPDSSKQELKGALTAADYALITGKQPLKFRILEWLNK